ncbi:MAG: DJ-1/PfpI family protein, partial [Acidimicrobiia bacterium]
VGADLGPCNGYEPFHRFQPDRDTTTVQSTDVLLVPGGLSSVVLMHRADVVAWMAATAAVSRYVLAISTGSQLVAAAGLLNDENASGHWLAAEYLEESGTHLSTDAVTWSGHVITTAGPAAAVDVAKLLPERILYGPAA